MEYPPYIFGTVHYQFRDIKMKTLCWSDNSIEPGQTAQTTLGSGRIRVEEMCTLFAYIGVKRLFFLKDLYNYYFYTWHSP